MRARLLIVAVVVGATALLVASPVSADDRPSGAGGAYLAPGGTPTAVASDGGSGGGGSGGSGGGGSPDNPCPWYVAVEDDFAFPVYDAVTGEPRHSASGRWLVRWCTDWSTNFDYFLLTPEGGLVDPYQLALDALASVSIAPPEIQTSPSEDGSLYVQVPTWLWLDQSWWQPYEATANAGRVSSTVRASPVATSWSLGDGNSVSCRGPGTPWRSGLPEDGSTCTHTYRSSSATRPGGTFHIEATVTIEVSWTTNVPGGGGTLPVITRTSTVDVEVGEIQAIGTQEGQ